MRRFIEGTDRGQSTLFPEILEDWIGGDNPVRVIEFLSTDSIWRSFGSMELLPKSPGGLRTIRRCC